jgi:fermentation-respiration switch protein FrsA (DUF1100 family)
MTTEQTPEYRKSRPGCQEKPLHHRALTLALLAGAALGLGSLAFAYRATHPHRRPLRGLPGDDGIEYEDVVFSSRDHLRLSGWFIPSPGAKAGVILCHGFPNNRSEMMYWARVLHEAGFHLLLFDFRALGESDGAMCSIGALEVNDLLGATDYFASRPEMRGLPIGVFGLSMGGAVAIMTAAEDERLKAVATHGAYATLEQAIAQRCRMILGPLGPALHRPAIWWGRRWFPSHPRDVSPVGVIGKIAPRPVLLFHGELDQIVRPSDGLALFRAARGQKALVPLRRSWHVRIHPNESEAYDAKLREFFRDSLIGE